MRGLSVWVLKNGDSTLSNASLNILLKNDITLSANSFPLTFQRAVDSIGKLSTQIAAVMAEIGMDE